RRLAAALARFDGTARGAGGGARNRSDRGPRVRDEPTRAPGVGELQVSWEPGWVVAWAAGPHARAADDEEVVALLAAAAAPASRRSEELQCLLFGALDTCARRSGPSDAHGPRDAGQRPGARPDGRRAGVDALGAHRHGGRDLSRQRPTYRGARAATDGPHGE